LKKKVLLVGSDGLVGSNLYRLLARYHNEIIDFLGISKRDVDLSSCSEAKLFANIIANYKPDCIIIFAATKRQFGDSKALLDYNNSITDNVVSVLGVQEVHTIYISSCAVYGEKKNHVQLTEDQCLEATSFYGEHKVYSEMKYGNNLDPSNLLILRPPLIYESGSKGYGPSGLISDSTVNKFIILWGDGKEVREFIHVHDAASCLIYAIKTALYGTFNLVSGKSYSYRDMAELIASLMPIEIHEQPRSSPQVNHTYKQHACIRDALISPFLSPLDFIHSEIIRMKLTNDNI
jgi:UDP-glucose 4-epimerase